MRVCFETLLDDEGFLKWLDNTVDYKLYSLNILKLSGNKENMRGRKTEALRHQDIYIFGTKFYHLRQFNKQ